MQRHAKFDADGVQVTSEIDDDGNELPDPVPMSPPVGYRREPTLGEMIQQFVRSEQLRAQAEAEGFDTFEEADDFDIPDDPLDPLTPWEEHFEPAGDGAAPPPPAGGGAAATAAPPSSGAKEVKDESAANRGPAPDTRNDGTGSGSGAAKTD